jgi:uncharacterized membrane protein
MLKTLVSKNSGNSLNQPLLWVRLSPNRSLSNEGTVFVFLILGVGLLLPIIPFIGSSIGIALTLFSGSTFYLFLLMLGKNFQSGQMYEEVLISSKKMQVIHKERNKKPLTWEGNPFWANVTMGEMPKKVENYLAIREKGQTIELGVFLSPDERLSLKNDIQTALSKARLAC